VAPTKSKHVTDPDKLPMPYIRWAKLCSAARYNLATSGLTDYPLSKLPVRVDDLEITGPGLYGYPPLRERLTRKTGASDENLVLSIGTSMANFIALSAMIERGDEVLIEQPTYQPLLQIAQWLGANIRRFERNPDENWKIDIAKLERELQPTTKLLVLTNLHNPSSALIDESTMTEIGRATARVGARVFVDEVYLETIFDHQWRSAFFLGDSFTVTSSLTKAYGLSGLRCGWILTQAELAERMNDLIDLTYGVPAHSAERLSIIALDHLAQIAQHSRDLLERNRAQLNSFLASQTKYLKCDPSRLGTTVSPRLRTGRVDEFCDFLRDEFETTVVPGRFFEAPDHFRIGVGGPANVLERGLEQIAGALEKFGG
jgi:aspartate/methionine/tyrosine aminotransferase